MTHFLVIVDFCLLSNGYALDHDYLTNDHTLSRVDALTSNDELASDK